MRGTFAKLNYFAWVMCTWIVMAAVAEFGAAFFMVNSAFALDADGDGYENITEVADGTDPNDPGSFKGVLNSPAYAPWNGFLNQRNILEIVNTGSSDVRVHLTIFDIHGNKGVEFNLPILAPSQQFDTILNDLRPGFSADSFGMVKIDFEGSVAGRVSYYRDGIGGGFEFAYALPVSEPIRGASSVGFNTFQPSAAGWEIQNGVANWHTLINLENVPKQYEVIMHDQEGKEVARNTVQVTGFGRIDLDGGHNTLGHSKVGLIRIVPADKHAAYISYVTRFGHDAPFGLASLTYSFAFPIMARAGNGRPLHITLSNRGGSQNWVEVLNASDETVSPQVIFYNSAGQAVYNETIYLPPFGQQHLNASKFLAPEDTGFATILPSHANSIIAQSMLYFRFDDGSISAMYGTSSREAFGAAITASYNLFLNMNNFAYLSNTSSEDINALITVTTGQSSHVEPILIGKHQTKTLALHDMQHYNTVPDSYGVVTIDAPSSSQLIAEIIRVRDGDFAFPTAAEHAGRATGIHLCDSYVGPYPEELIYFPEVKDGVGYDLDPKTICGTWLQLVSDLNASALYSFYGDGTYSVEYEYLVAKVNYMDICNAERAGRSARDTGYWFSSDNSIEILSTYTYISDTCPKDQDPQVEEYTTPELWQSEAYRVDVVSLFSDAHQLQYQSDIINPGIAMVGSFPPRWRALLDYEPLIVLQRYDATQE